MHVLHKGDPWVIEYSDMSDEMKQRTNKDGSLAFGQGFICTFFGTLEYFEKVQNLDMYHVAKKAVPFWDDDKKEQVKPEGKNGVKFELFIFDAFSYIRKGGFALMECDRNEEFAPIKNKDEAKVDCAASARDLISKLH